MAGKVFSDIYNESARDTGDTTSSHVTYVKKKVNDALREIVSMMNYSWMKRQVDIDLEANTQEYAMSGIASDWDEDTPVDIWYRGPDNDRVVLDPFDDEEWYEEEDQDTGDIHGYNISKKSGSWKISFVLIPDSNFISDYSPLKMDYLKQVTELSADEDVPELPSAHHQAIVYWTNMLICAEMGDDAGVNRWMALANRSLGLLKKKQVSRLGRAKRVYPRTGVTIKGRGVIRRDYNK